MSNSASVIFVVDTSALLGRLQYAAEEVLLVTTPVIIREMIRRGLRDRIQLLQDTQKLQVLEPSDLAMRSVADAAIGLGDLPYLSDADRQLIALAVDLQKQNYHVILLTDDYSIQNVATHLSIEFRSPTQRGIREVIQWETYCNACKQQYPELAKNEPCPICGTPLKRRATKKQQIAK